MEVGYHMPVDERVCVNSANEIASEMGHLVTKEWSELNFLTTLLGFEDTFKI